MKGLESKGYLKMLSVCTSSIKADFENNKTVWKYLLLTEFEVRTVSYGPSFFPSIHGSEARGP